MKKLKLQSNFSNFQGGNSITSWRTKEEIIPFISSCDDEAIFKSMFTESLATGGKIIIPYDESRFNMVGCKSTPIYTLSKLTDFIENLLGVEGTVNIRQSSSGKSLKIGGFLTNNEISIKVEQLSETVLPCYVSYNSIIIENKSYLALDKKEKLILFANSPSFTKRILMFSESISQSYSVVEYGFLVECN